MQVNTEQLQRQQLIMQALGFYFGKIDGVWGPRSIEAKKRFEADPTFRPGIPANGMPFGDRPPYPAGVTYDHATGLLYHPKIEEHLKPTIAKVTVNVEPAAEDSDE